MDVINLTRELVRIPSESSVQVEKNDYPEAAVVEYLRNLCKKAGLDCQTITALPGRENFIVHFSQPGKPQLLIVAHMDTVSAQGMANPHLGELWDDKVHGRGSCDDKGPLAAALVALLDLHADDIEMAYDITFAATVDEECTMSGAMALADYLPGWELCIALEPTNLQIIRAHKGVYRFMVQTTGRAAHSSEPEKGDNAIDKMLPIIADIKALGQELCRSTQADLGRASLAVTKINGGASLNMIPDTCEAAVDIRLLPDMLPDVIAARIKDCVAGRGEVVEVYQGLGIQTSMDNPLIVRLREEIGKVTGESEPICAAFATDCSKLAHKGPCIVWGPGDIAQAHKVDEYIEIDQLTKAVTILKNFLVADD